MRGPFDKQHGKHTQALLKSESQQLDPIQLSLPSRWSWKKSLLLTCKILVLLVNTLAGDEKYPVLNRDNLMVPIQMEFSKKQKKISIFFSAFLKLSLNFEHFEKIDDPHSFRISEITDSENVVR